MLSRLVTRSSLAAAQSFSFFPPSWSSSHHLYSTIPTLQPSTAIPYEKGSNRLVALNQVNALSRGSNMSDNQRSVPGGVDGTEIVPPSLDNGLLKSPEGNDTQLPESHHEGEEELQPEQQKTTAKAYVPPRLKKKKERSPRTKPSPASGGVPDPSTPYLKQSSHPSSQLASPRRILVIIDLNGTLLYRPSKRNPFHFEPRPHASYFLEYCVNTFVVGVWSSARPQNVSKMVEKLLTPEQRSKCAILWARDQFGLTKDDYDARVQCYKRLTRVWADTAAQATHPDTERGGRWDQSNTVLVDDSIEKGRSEPHNLLEIPEFTGVQNEVAEVLPQVHDYLNQLCWQGDVSCYIRRNPFELDPNYRLAD